jgi:hypothetical protein
VTKATKTSGRVSQERNDTVLTIVTSRDLDHLSRGAALRGVRLQSTVLAPEEAAAWQTRLTTLMNSCGCDVATVFFLGAVIACGAALYTYWQLAAQRPVLSALLALGFVLVSVGTGRGFGRLRAEHELSRAIHDLKLLLADRE